MRRVLILLLWPMVALAGDAPDLPTSAQVDQALRAHPLVRAASYGVQAEQANRDRLEAGSHEFALRLASQQRRERPLGLSYREHEIGIERAIRLPGKAAKDAELGAVGVEQARFALGDAVHESARLLLSRWFEWQREAAAVTEWTAQVETLQRQHDVVGKRVGAGDAAKLEELLSGAQLAQAQVQQAQAGNRQERAALEFAQHFPAIALPAHAASEGPPAIGDAPAVWRERILAHSHELSLASGGARRGRLLAQRLDAERLPDPTVGLSYGSERDGQERIVGLQLTIPLPGGGRAASARAGAAEAETAGAREALVLARVEAEAQRTVRQAQSSREQWLRQADVARRMDDNVRLLEKAWRLGEGQFAELQNARRQAIEARLAATQARLDASEARYRLLLDAHQLWNTEGE
ncbi:MAG: TolC family protein [Sulfuritalea sp.]|nr:TolC family protein [Sulfuritalea sp.]